MRTAAQILLFVLTVLELALGLVAGTVARAATAVDERFARRFRLARVSPKLRKELADVLYGIATPAGGSR
ncbi:hypothetical protein [Streptomyces sp. S1]|uniref:hypothetical protein n=1 Tax=Streptomyces sp. S1 TaxID=718288 RepID=UPI003D747787